jgi:transforming growth factor-beta-induced protein
MARAPWLLLVLAALCAAGGAAGAASQCQSLDDIIGRTPNLSRLATLKSSIPESVKREFAARDGTRLTFFAPGDAAWAALPSNLLANSTKVKLLLDYHTVLSVKPLAQLGAGERLVTTLKAAGPLEVVRRANATTIVAVRSRAAIQTPDVATCRGVLHIIDAVLLPPLSALQ